MCHTLHWIKTHKCHSVVLEEVHAQSCRCLFPETAATTASHTPSLSPSCITNLSPFLLRAGFGRLASSLFMTEGFGNWWTVPQYFRRVASAIAGTAQNLTQQLVTFSMYALSLLLDGFHI